MLLLLFKESAVVHALGSVSLDAVGQATTEGDFGVYVTHELSSVTLDAAGHSTIPGSADTTGLLTRIGLAGVGQRSLGTHTLAYYTWLDYATTYTHALDAVTLDTFGRSALAGDTAQEIGLGDVTVDATGHFAPDATIAIEAIHALGDVTLEGAGTLAVDGDPVSGVYFALDTNALDLSGAVTLAGDFGISTYVPPQPEEPAGSRRSKRAPSIKPLVDAVVLLRSKAKGAASVGTPTAHAEISQDDAEAKPTAAIGTGRVGVLRAEAQAHEVVVLKGCAGRAQFSTPEVDGEVVAFARVDPKVDCTVQVTFRNAGRVRTGRLMAKGIVNPTDEELLLLIATVAQRPRPWR